MGTENDKRNGIVTRIIARIGRDAWLDGQREYAIAKGQIWVEHRKYAPGYDANLVRRTAMAFAKSQGHVWYEPDHVPTAEERKLIHDTMVDDFKRKKKVWDTELLQAIDDYAAGKREFQIELRVRRQTLAEVLRQIIVLPNGSGMLFAAQETIASRAGVRRETVNRTLAKLEEAGILKRVSTGGIRLKDGKTKANKYHVCYQYLRRALQVPLESASVYDITEEIINNEIARMVARIKHYGHEAVERGKDGRNRHPFWSEGFSTAKRTWRTVDRLARNWYFEQKQPCDLHKRTLVIYDNSKEKYTDYRKGYTVENESESKNVTVEQLPLTPIVDHEAKLAECLAFLSKREYQPPQKTMPETIWDNLNYPRKPYVVIDHEALMNEARKILRMQLIWNE